MDHIPVLLDQVIDQLNIKEDGIYLDLTLGRGGHSSQILKKLTSGKLIVFDKDKQAIEQTKEKLLKISSNIEFIWSDFKDFDQELKTSNQQSRWCITWFRSIFTSVRSSQ